MSKYTLPSKEIVERITHMVTEGFRSFGGG